MNSCSASIYIGLLMCVIIIVYFKTLANHLDLVIMDRPRLTLWSMTHLMTYYAMGKLCPKHYSRYFALGVVWEVFEKVYGRLTCNESYWTGNGLHGQFSDIVMNMIGYHLAHLF